MRGQSRARVAAVLLAAALGLPLAGCGSDSGDDPGTTGSDQPTSSSSPSDSGDDGGGYGY